MDKLFFGEIEREAKKAESAYMASRGKHEVSKEETRKFDVAGQPGSKNDKKMDGGE